MCVRANGKSPELGPYGEASPYLAAGHAGLGGNDAVCGWGGGLGDIPDKGGVDSYRDGGSIIFSDNDLVRIL